VHEALFALRHDEGGHLKDEGEVRRVLEAHGVDADVVFDEIATGAPIAAVQAAHESVARGQKVWGVPTFIIEDRAVFVRLMDRAGSDPDHSIRSVDRILDLLADWPELNEFKHTSIPR
jgi:2-hydroxychromene-2-carboxylate isomerase